jgi:hypothetical protein
VIEYRATETGEPEDPNLGCQTTGCLAGALLMSVFAAVVVLFVSREPHGWMRLALGVPLAGASVVAWGIALLVRARVTGSRRERMAGFVVLGAGTLLVLALVAIVTGLS